VGGGRWRRESNGGEEKPGLTHQNSIVGSREKKGNFRQIHGSPQIMPEENLLASLNLLEKQEVAFQFSILWISPEDGWSAAK